MRKLFAALSILVVIISIQCKKRNPDPDPTPTPTPTPSTNITVTVSGYVLDNRGIALPGASVSSYGVSGLTNADGSYQLKNVTMPASGGVVRASANIAGIWSNIKLAWPDNKSKMAYANFRMSEPGITSPLDNNTGGKVSLGNGTEVTFLAGFAVKEDGTSYSGQVTIILEYLSPYDPYFTAFAPGSMSKTDASNNFEYLKDDYGMIQVLLKGTSNENLKLGTGIKAHIKIPIPASMLATATNTVPLLYLDETTGYWKLDVQQGTKNGNFYEADVDHFTWWTFANLGCSKELFLTIADANGVPLPAQDVKLINLGNNQLAPLLAYTFATGVAHGKVPCNTPLKAEITICGTVYSQNINPVSVDPTYATATFTIPATQMVTLKGKFVDCNGNVLNFSQGAINYDLTTHTWNNSYGNSMLNKSLIDGNNGTFSYSYPVCSFPQQVKFYADWNGTVFNDSIIFTVSQAGVFDFGNIVICNTTPTYYFKWKVDNDPMHIVTDSLKIFQYIGGPPPAQKTQIGGKASADFEGYLILYGNGGGINDTCYTGMLNWGGGNSNEYYNIHGNDIKVSFTQFGTNSGDLITGTFTGTMFNGSNHVVTGSFNFKRP